MTPCVVVRHIVVVQPLQDSVVVEEVTSYQMEDLKVTSHVIGDRYVTIKLNLINLNVF